MPGVGVAPFGTALMAFAGGIPGVEFPDGCIGWGESPGGRFPGSRFDGRLESPERFEFVSAADPHAITIKVRQSKKRKERDLNIAFSIGQILGYRNEKSVVLHTLMKLSPVRPFARPLRFLYSCCIDSDLSKFECRQTFPPSMQFTCGCHRSVRYPRSRPSILTH